MAFKVKVVLDSVSPLGQRLATFKTEFPREILAEVNTHGILSRNAASSRAIPFVRMVEKLTGNRAKGIKPDPYVPIHFGRNRAGMQAVEEVDDASRDRCRAMWLEAMGNAVRSATRMADEQLHKQVINRLIEPWSWTRQVITGTQWANFFALRTHKAAHPAFQLLARAMYVAYSRSTPKPLQYSEWHLPFIRPEDYPIADEWSRKRYVMEGPLDQAFARQRDYHLCRWSAARCARVSYETLDGKAPTPEADDSTWGKLADSVPMHASPLGHQAAPKHPAYEGRYNSNLAGWIQFRKTIAGECTHDFNPSDEEVASWGVPEEIFDDQEEVRC